MNLTTNIVLTGNNGSTQPYMIEMFHREGNVDTYKFSNYTNGKNTDYILNSVDHQDSLLHIQNEWYWRENVGDLYNLESSIIRFYFPQYSVDTYDSNITYVLDMCTYIHGHRVDLGTRLFRRADALACPVVGKGTACEYYEYIDFEIPNPFYLQYDSGSAESIRNIIGNPQNINSNSSILSFTLSIVDEVDDHYILRDGWTTGQNGLAIDKPQDMKLSINYDNDEKQIHMDLSWNKSYDLFYEYLRDTYHSLNTSFIWEYVVMDDNDIYYKQSKIVTYTGTGGFNYSFSCSFRVNIYNGSIDSSDNVPVVVDGDLFSSWDNWKDGLVIQGSVSLIDVVAIQKADGNIYDAVPYAVVFSNKIPVSQELFSEMVQREGYEDFPTKIELNNIDMNNYNLTIPNVINQTINTVTPVDSTKSHMIQPVFYQTRPISGVTIHPAVTENICINLDSYKSQVSTFAVQIEGVSFKEIGRISGGVIFKIMGNMLPKEENSGTLYILNERGSLVTTGKYNYKY